MGYRSEVILVVGKEVMPQFLVTLAKSGETRALCYHSTSKYIQNHEEEGTCDDGMVDHLDPAAVNPLDVERKKTQYNITHVGH